MATQTLVGIATMETATRVRDPGPHLISTGLLWEINRSVLHPNGHQLAVDPVTGEFEVYYDFDRPWVYDVENYRRGQSKYRNFLAKVGYLVERMRRSILGFVVQLHPDYRRQPLEIRRRVE